MFDKKEIELVKSLHFLDIPLDFNNLSSDDYAEIKNALEDEYVVYCMNSEYEPNERGLMCEKLINKIALNT